MGFEVKKLKVNIKGKQKNCWGQFFLFLYIHLYIIRYSKYDMIFCLGGSLKDWSKSQVFFFLDSLHIY